MQEAILAVIDERQRQILKWGWQGHYPFGTGPGRSGVRADRAKMAKQACDSAFADGSGTWRHILQEEVAEAMAEDDPVKLREELTHVAAVAVAWIEAIIDRTQEATE